MQFQKIFVSGLPARTDRGDAMAVVAAANNLEIEFIDGVVGSTMLDKAFRLEVAANILEMGRWVAGVHI
jgi:hypothetical protein